MADRFLEKLAHDETLDAEQLAELKTLLTSGKKPKPDDLVKLFARPSGELQ